MDRQEAPTLASLTLTDQMLRRSTVPTGGDSQFTTALRESLSWLHKPFQRLRLRPDVLGRRGRSAQALVREIGRGAFADARCARQDEPPRVREFSRKWRTLGRRTFKPCDTIVLGERAHKGSRSEGGGNSRGRALEHRCFHARDTWPIATGSFDFVIAVTLAWEGNFRARADGAANPGRVRTGGGQHVLGELGWRRIGPKNETSQTQRVTGRSPEQPSPKCCSRTSLRGDPGDGNGSDGLCA